MTARYGALFGILAFVALPAGASETGHHWSYSGDTGPSHWSQLEPDYAVCGTGKTQSPVNIETAHVQQQELPPLIFNYHPSTMRIVDNGHTVQVSVPPGDTLTVGDHRYTLVQFHFHHPSEEALDGKSFDMVAHLVHRDEQGHLAVVAVPLQKGAANPLLSTLWQNLPHERGHEAAPAGVAINAAALLPADLSYYTYTGSLTTPPCSESVRWFVLKSPMTLSADQVATFAKLYPANARVLQPLNGRAVLSSK
jgi:carbonic anhydrase